MSAQKNYFLMAFCLLNLLDPGWVRAAPVFDPDIQPIGYVGMPEVSSNNVSSGSEQLFSIDYSSQNWSGNLHSHLLTGAGVAGTTEDWDGGAAGQIDLQNVTSGTWNTTGRMIVTMSGTTGIPFVWNSLTSVQKGDLDPSTLTTALSSPVLNYIRGERLNESPSGLSYRARSTALGDIIHSTPVYWSDGTNKTVFVGANDGMLHAINATDGSERFAYIPSMLLPKLKDLKTNPYIHKYFVDGRMDIRTFGTTTILAGTLGSGGKGLFALNVSNAAATSEADAASKILWEASNTGSYANLGYTYGQPRLTLLSGGTNALIVGNGYNNTGNYGSSLFVINANTGAVLNEIAAGSGTVTSPNGLSSPTLVDSDVDGDADIAYAGDIDGNLWKFDLVANTSTLLYSQSQSITMAPGVKAHPNGGFIVTFVTGRLFAAADVGDTTVHAAYGIWDRPAAYITNDTLLEQTLTEDTYTGTPDIRVRKATSNVPNWSAGAGNHKGWKTVLPIGGERVVGDGAYVSGSYFLFMSTNPAVSTTATPPGENWWMHLNALSGGDNGTIRFDLNGDAAFTSADQLTGGVSPVGVYVGGGALSQRVELSTVDFPIYLYNYDQNGAPAIPVVPSDERGVIGGHFDEDIFYDFATTCPTTGGTPGVKAVGSVSFNYASSGTAKTVTSLKIVANRTTVSGTISETIYDGVPGSKKPRDLDGFVKANQLAPNYTVTDGYGDDHTIKIQANNSGTAYNGTITVTMTVTSPTTTPVYAKVDLAGGTNDIAGSGASGTCASKKHVHEYDDLYDKTGVNMLDAAEIRFNLSNAIPSTTTAFKVLAQNQYLSPAVNIHIGNSAYLFDNSAGYIPLKTFMTSAALDVTDNTQAPTYTRATVGSLAINMPTDAFAQKDWWGGALGLPADVRVGLHPTQTSCVKSSAGARDGNMYQPVIPPATVTATGNGTLGYGTGTTSLTATGVRHNGALIIQVIRADTPNSAIEMSIPGSPQYGWRVKSANYNTYVLAEYTTFWHEQIGGQCYGATGWTKLALTDLRECGTSDTATTQQCVTAPTTIVGTDPKIGSFSSDTPPPPPGVYVVSVVVTTSADGSVTTVTTTYSDGTVTTIVTNNSIKTAEGDKTPSEVLGRVNWRELQ